MPYVREFHEDREITAWFLLDLSPSVDFGTVGDGPAQADGAGRLHGDAGPGADPARQPDRGDRLRGGRRADDPGRVGAARGPAAGRRAAPASRCWTPRPATDLGELLGRGPADDPAPLAGGRRLGLHQRARLGGAAAPAQPAPRAARGPARGPARADAARRRGGGRSRTRRRASSWRSTPPTASSGSGSRRRPPSARREVDRRCSGAAGVEAVTLSTEDDLVRAIVRMAAERRRRRDPRMTFDWPLLLLAVLLVPARDLGRRAGSTGAPARAGRGAGGVARDGAAATAPARRAARGAALLDRAAGRAAWSRRSSCWPWRSPGRPATVALPRLEGTLMLVFDVSGTHGRRRRRAQPDGGGQGRSPATSSARRPEGVVIGVVAFSDAGVARPGADRAT